jgi:DNA-binding transcriptional ArsR family regulator
MNRSRAFQTILCLVIGAAFLPIFFALRPLTNDIKASSNSLSSLSLSGSSAIVPIVIAASFTRITDDDNNLVFKAKLDTASALSTRENIFALIEQNPGIHFRDVCRQLKKEIGVVQYHVYILKKFGLISSEKDGRFTRFYAKNAKFDDMARGILASWQRPVERNILSTLAKNGPQQGMMKSIMSSSDVTSQAVTWHLNRLKANGLISSDTVGSPVLTPGAQERINSMARQGIIAL